MGPVVPRGPRGCFPPVIQKNRLDAREHTDGKTLATGPVEADELRQTLPTPVELSSEDCLLILSGSGLVPALLALQSPLFAYLPNTWVRVALQGCE